MPIQYVLAAVFALCFYVLNTYVCMYACMHACMHTCMHAYMHVYTYVCMYVCMYACMYIQRTIPYPAVQTEVFPHPRTPTQEKKSPGKNPRHSRRREVNEKS